MQTLEIETRVSKATVYTDRALITRFHQQRFAQGKWLVKIINLPDQLSEESFRVSASGTAMTRITDVKLKEEFLDRIPHEKLEELSQQLISLNDEQTLIDKQLETLLHQKEFVTSIKVFSAESISKDLQSSRPAIEDWDKTISFIGRHLLAINREIFTLNKQKSEIKLQIQKLQAQINEFSAARSYRRKCALLELEILQPGELEIEVCYLSHHASWYPVYDARINSDTKTVELHYYGMVRQQTAEDWNDVEIQLSSAKAYIGGNPPALQEWLLEEVADEPMTKGIKKKSAVAPVMARAMLDAPMGGAMEEAKKMAEIATTTVTPNASGTSVVFKTPGRNTIPGDNSVTKVKIMQRDFGAKFKYFAVPKLSLYAYLTAEVVNTSDYPLLVGQISIFLDENFVGNARLPELITPDEKFDLSLGIDESIKINHRLLKKQSNEKGIFSKDKTLEYSYLISIKNHRKTEEEITVWDQLPVAGTEKIKVNIKRLEPAENPEKDIRKIPQGTVEWKINVRPQEEKDLSLSFMVQHPSEMDVYGL